MSLSILSSIACPQPFCNQSHNSEIKYHVKKIALTLHNTLKILYLKHKKSLQTGMFGRIENRGGKRICLRLNSFHWYYSQSIFNTVIGICLIVQEIEISRTKKQIEET